MIQQSQLQSSSDPNSAALVQNDQSLDSRITALERAVNLLMNQFKHFQDTGVVDNNDEDGLNGIN